MGGPADAIRAIYEKQVADAEGAAPSSPAASEAPAAPKIVEPFPGAFGGDGIPETSGLPSPPPAVVPATPGAVPPASPAAPGAVPGQGEIPTPVPALPAGQERSGETRHGVFKQRTGGAGSGQPGPAPSVSSPEVEALRRQNEAIRTVLLNNPEAREAFFRAAQGATGDPGSSAPAELPPNFEELGERERAVALRDYLAAEMQRTLAPQLARADAASREIAEMRAQVQDQREYAQLVNEHPEAANVSPEIEAKIDGYLDRFASLPRDQQPSLLDAYRVVMAPVWSQALRTQRVNQHADPRRAAAQIQHPGGGAPSSGEVVLDVRQLPNDRAAFAHAAAEAMRMLNLT